MQIHPWYLRGKHSVCLLSEYLISDLTNLIRSLLLMLVFSWSSKVCKTSQDKTACPYSLTSSTNLKLKFKRDFKEQIEQLGVMDLKQMLSIWFFPISSSLSTTSSSRPPCLPTKWSIEECRSFPKLNYFQSGARNCKSLDVHNPPAFVQESDVVRDFNSCS